jgi:hypothetical protein
MDQEYDRLDAENRIKLYQSMSTGPLCDILRQFHRVDDKVLRQFGYLI